MMGIDRLKQHSEESLGEGIDKLRIRDFEMRMDVRLPDDYKKFLETLNYAELYNDPLYGINPEMPEIDIYSQNKGKEHFRYGFLEFFCNDIDGTVYMRVDSGKIYNTSFMQPIADSFNDFLFMILNE